MVQFLQVFRRTAPERAGQPPGLDQSLADEDVGRDLLDEEIGAGMDEGPRLRSTAEQLNAAAALIEGLGQIRKIGVEEDRVDLNGREAERGTARRGLSGRRERSNGRRDRAGFFNRLERAFAPLAYPG